jgi:hypothetical protein
MIEVGVGIQDNIRTFRERAVDLVGPDAGYDHRSGCAQNLRCRIQGGLTGVSKCDSEAASCAGCLRMSWKSLVSVMLPRILSTGEPGPLQRYRPFFATFVLRFRCTSKHYRSAVSSVHGLRVTEIDRQRRHLGYIDRGMTGKGNARSPNLNSIAWTRQMILHTCIAQAAVPQL